ncbi:MAG TPA: alpha-L-fucosidase [Candidatus Limnocylindrales bacterium]|nr:alpha-L-fucosidase [Candidatus Limnocylindrales bacterium]
MASGAGLAASFPLALDLGQGKEVPATADAGSPNSFSPADWDSVVKEDWGPTGSAAGPDTWDGVPLQAPSIPDLAGAGPFQPDWPSLLGYEVPEWYRDAKFGIWAHWSPQCVPEDGDWYARAMYFQGKDQYNYHLRHYNHPSKFGYKDLCAQWTLLNWEPDALMERYQRAGARLFLALANHHDGFDTWNSKHHAWNAQNIGPRRDVIGAWADAARKRGLRFGVTVHAARNWWWFQVAHLCDRTGPLAGVPYDGHLTLTDGNGQWWEGYDPQKLYGCKHGIHENPDEAYVRNFYDRVRDLIDQHDPDLLYFDNGGLPLGWAGMNLGAYFYNHNLQTRGGKLEAVLNIKGVPDNQAKAVVADYERGVTDRVMPYPWQSETCIGEWHYNRALFVHHSYMKPAEAIHWMVDAVSKNGTFVLNIPGKPDGTIDTDEKAILEAIGDWMRINGEAIYATRPWKICGEGAHEAKGGAFAGQSTGDLDARDIRFTRNKRGDVVYAIVLGWPEGDIVVKNLGTEASAQPGKVENVEMLGCEQKLTWSQSSESLTVKKPAAQPCDFAIALKVSLA